MLRELAEVAAGKAADHQGFWATELLRTERKIKLLWAVCRRISHIERHIRQNQELPPATANDICNSVGFEGAKRRQAAIDKGRQALDKLEANHGHVPVLVG